MKYEHPEFERIVVDSEVCFGKPHVKGTRIPVSSVLAYLSSGMTVEELTEELPNLKREDVFEALSFASQMMNERILPVHRKAS